MSEPARYAATAAESRGRRHGESHDATRGPRDAFQRDRDRVIHAIAFRRLRHKTQVFVAPDGDHFRVRLTHSIEVAQIGRTIARTLGLNEDLTEALCLAHDIGHPPFGHAGEEALKAASAHAGGFDHNAHTLRVLAHLESPYPRWNGLNLTWDTLEGLAKHNGPVADPPWALAAVDADFPLALGDWPSLEAQVAAIADDIAYDNHDIDDGVRSGILDFDAVTAVPIAAGLWRGVVARHPGAREATLRAELIRDQIGAMVNDVIAETRRRIADAGVETLADVRSAGRELVGFSDAMRADERTLKRFMYANLYHSPQQLRIADKARALLGRLVATYCAEPALMGGGWAATLPRDEPWRTRHVVDYVAGMTDRYAIARHVALIGPVEIDEGF